MKRRHYGFFLPPFWLLLFLSYTTPLMYSGLELGTKSGPLDFTQDIYSENLHKQQEERAISRGVRGPFRGEYKITTTMTVDSWEDLGGMYSEEDFLENNGDSTIEVTGACVKHRPISITPSPYMGNSEPYTITWAVTDSTVEAGGTTSLWMDMQFNCSGKIEVTDVEVYYLYKGRRYTATMDMESWIIDVVVKDESGDLGS
jgi:hypothetical protein